MHGDIPRVRQALQVFVVGQEREPHRNQHELSQPGWLPTPGRNLGAEIPIHLGTTASSETGVVVIHPRGLEISIMTCHGAGPALAAGANNPPHH